MVGGWANKLAQPLSTSLGSRWKWLVGAVGPAVLILVLVSRGAPVRPKVDVDRGPAPAGSLPAPGAPPSQESSPPPGLGPEIVPLNPAPAPAAAALKKARQRRSRGQGLRVNHATLQAKVHGGDGATRARRHAPRSR
jgi:hypothetical protein